MSIEQKNTTIPPAEVANNNGATGNDQVIVNIQPKEEKSEIIDVNVNEKPKNDKITLNFGKGAKVGSFIQTKSESEVLNNQSQQNPISGDSNAQLQSDIKTLNSIDDEVKKFQNTVTTQEEFLDMAEMLLMGLDWGLGWGFAVLSKDPKAKASQYEADAEKIKKLKPYVAKMLMQMKKKFPLWFFMALLFIAAYAPPFRKMLAKRDEITESEEAKKKEKKLHDEQKKIEAEKLANAEKLRQTVQPVIAQPRELIIRQEPPVVKREIVVPQPPVIAEPSEKEIPKPRRVNVRELIKVKKKTDEDNGAEETPKIAVPTGNNKNRVPRIPRTGRKTDK